MKLWMTGVDFTRAPLEKREKLAPVRGQVLTLLPRIAAEQGVSACVLLATCNRTELYFRAAAADDPLALLCRAAGVETADFRAYSVMRSDRQAANHLLHVAAGLESQIFGDDQIVTQVGDALVLARQAGTTDAVLDTLFRRAVTAGKRVRTETRLTGVPVSAAARGAALAERFFASLAGKRAAVIGNGEMGRLAAAALRDRGAEVTVTLRSYRHGETVVPAGCATWPYEDRYALLEGMDLAFSATASPHYTLTAQGFAALQKPPALVVDLAMPRDVEGAVGDDPRVTVWNLDDLGDLGDENAGAVQTARRIIEEELAEFYAWYAYRQSLPAIAAIKDAAIGRLRFDHAFAALHDAGDTDGLAELAVNKTVDLLLGGMKDVIDPERLEACLAHIRKGSGK